MDLASAYFSKGQPRLALVELDKIKEQARDIPYYYFLKGLVYLQLKDIDKGIMSFKTAIELDPNYGDAWNNLGLAYLAAKNEEKAIECFEKALAIESYPTPEFAAHNLALVYFQKKDIDKAIAYDEKAITQNWRFLPSYLTLIKLFIQKNDIDSAIFWARKGIEAFPDNVELYYMLGENYLRLGKKEEAKKAFLEVLALDKEFKTKFAKLARDYLDIL